MTAAGERETGGGRGGHGSSGGAASAWREEVEVGEWAHVAVSFEASQDAGPSGWVKAAQADAGALKWGLIERCRNLKEGLNRALHVPEGGAS